MRLNFFNKGLNTRLAKHLVPNGAGVVYENIDNSKGHFVPEKDKLADTTITGVLDYGYFFEQENEWQFTTTKQDYVVYSRQLFRSDRSTLPQKRVDSTTWRNLGIAGPSTAPTVVGTDGPSVISRLSLTEDNTSGDIPASTTLQYIAVNVDTTTSYGTIVGSKNFDPATEVGLTTIEQPKFQRNIGSASGLLGSLLKKVPIPAGASARRIAISCDDTNFADEVEIYRLFDGAWRLVGTIANSGDTIYDDTFDISGEDELDAQTLLANGVLQYAVTFYNSVDGTESVPVLTDEVDVQFGKVDLTSIPVSSDPQVDKKRIYRIGNFVTTFTEVAEIDNSTTSYTDVAKDIELNSTNLLSSSTYEQAPEGLQYLTEANAMLFGALGAQLRFTPIGQPNAWPATFFLQFPETIQGIAKVQLGLLIFIEDAMYLVSGTSPTSLSQQPVTGNQGCVSHDSIVNIAGTALWASKDGICASNGTEPTVITKASLGKILFDVVNAVIYDEQYYLQLSDKSTFVWDFRFDPLPKYVKNDVVSLAVANDTLYGFDSNTAYKLFASDDNLTARFKTGWLFNGPLAQEKVLDQLRGYCLGDVAIAISLNGEQSNLFEFNDYVGTIDNKTSKQHSRYNYVELEVTGTGEILELSWEDEKAHG